MWLIGKKDHPFKDDRLNNIWLRWNDKCVNNEWESIKTNIKNNLFEPLTVFAELPGIISPREANKNREKAEKLSTEFAKISFYVGLDFASRESELALRVPAGGEIPEEALDMLKKIIEPAYEFCRSLIMVAHNQRSSVIERDNFIVDTKRVLSEQALKSFEAGLAASR